MRAGETWKRVKKWHVEHRSALILEVIGAIFACLLIVLGPLLRDFGGDIHRRLRPTPTPNRDLSEEVKRFVRTFWGAEKEAFKSGDLDSVEDWFCTNTGYGVDWLGAFGDYKEDARHMTDLGLCPYELDAIDPPEGTSWVTGDELEVWTTERWAEGPCPTDASGGSVPHRKRLIIQNLDSAWCISDFKAPFVQPW